MDSIAIKRMRQLTRLFHVPEEKGFYLIKRADRKRRLAAALLPATGLTVGKNGPLLFHDTMNNWFVVSLFRGLRNDKGA